MNLHGKLTILLLIEAVEFITCSAANYELQTEPTQPIDNIKPVVGTSPLFAFQQQH
jgi:hypothetical protein